MSFRIPSECRLQCDVLVSDREVARSITGYDYLRTTANDVAHKALAKLCERCVTVSSHDAPTMTTIISLDCYVFTPTELMKLLKAVRDDGANDATRWWALQHSVPARAGEGEA